MYNCYDQQVNFIQWCSLTFRFRREFEVRRERVEEGGGGDERIVDWQPTKTGCARWGLRGKEGWWEEECPSWLPFPRRLSASGFTSLLSSVLSVTPVPVVELWGVHTLLLPFGAPWRWNAYRFVFYVLVKWTWCNSSHMCSSNLLLQCRRLTTKWK